MYTYNQNGEKIKKEKDSKPIKENYDTDAENETESLLSQVLKVILFFIIMAILGLVIYNILMIKKKTSLDSCTTTTTSTLVEVSAPTQCGCSSSSSFQVV